MKKVQTFYFNLIFINKEQKTMYKTILRFAHGIEFIAVVLSGPSAVLTDVSMFLKRIAENKIKNDDDDEIQ